MSCHATGQSGVRHKDFIDSVERGWYELRSGIGETVAEKDDFFDSIKKEMRNSKKTA